MQKKALIIQVTYPGLGDHLLYSHIPRIAIETGAYEQVFISSQSCYRNPEVRKLVWELNPFVTGFTEAPGRAHIVTHETEHENILDKIMMGFQLEDGKRGHEPEIYYQPEFKLEYNLNIYDPNYISVGGKNITREDVEKYFRAKEIIIDASMSVRNDNAIALPPHLHKHRYLDAPLFTFCDIIFSCKSLYCLVTGTATLAAALNRSATVFYSTGVKNRFLHSQQHTYIFFLPAVENSTQIANETHLAKNIAPTNFLLLNKEIYQRMNKAWRTVKRSPKLMKKYLRDKAFPIVELDQNLQPRLTWLEKALSAIPRGQRILDAGAGQRALEPFCAHLIYVAQDFAEYDGRGDGKGLQTGVWDQTKLDIICDICAIPEPDASFDAILCTEVLEHLPAPIAAVKELSRLLKPGGELILTAPFCACTHFAPYFYGTGFSQYWYEKHLTEAGLAIEEITPNGNFSSYLLQEVGRIPSIAKKYTKVKLSLFDRIGLRLVKVLLSKMLQSDAGSHEFLNFGYHVRAIKK